MVGRGPTGPRFTRPDGMRERLAGERAELLDQAAARLRRPGLDVVTRLRTGRAASLIVETAEELRADLIVLGARSHGTIERAMLVPCPPRSSTRRAAPSSSLAAARQSGSSSVPTGRRNRCPPSRWWDAAASSARPSRVWSTPPTCTPTWWLGAVPTDAAVAAESFYAVSDLAPRTRGAGDGGGRRRPASRRPRGQHLHPRRTGLRRDRRRGDALAGGPGRRRHARPRARQAAAPGEHGPVRPPPCRRVGADHPEHRRFRCRPASPRASRWPPPRRSPGESRRGGRCGRGRPVRGSRLRPLRGRDAVGSCWTRSSTGRPSWRDV